MPFVTRDSPRRHSFRSAAFALSVGLIATGLGVLEAWERHTGNFANYFELNGLRDTSRVPEQLAEPYLFVYKPNRHITTPKKEFTIDLMTNSLGLVAPEIPVTPRPNEFRIITLGDSFTEGVGAAADGSYPALLQKMLAARAGPRTFTVMNAGIGGSDPVFEIELLRRKLLPYRPDLVVLAMNYSDVPDLRRRGGFDRYRPDGQLRGLEHPWWIWFFDRSHLVRALVLGGLHYDWELRSPAESAASVRIAVRELVEAGATLGTLAAANGFRAVIVVHPDWKEVNTGTQDARMAEVLEAYRQAGLDCANLLPFFRAAMPIPVPVDYYWPRDTHYTAKGYEVFARAVMDQIDTRLGEQWWLNASPR